MSYAYVNVSDIIMCMYPLIVVTGGSVSSRQQSFVVKPQDVEVVVGMTVKLQCFVVGQ